MAYTIENLDIIGGKGKRGEIPAFYTYYNSATDTVTTAGYFANKSLVVGDQITVLAAAFTAKVDYRVSAVANGAATVIVLA